ncbi:MAG: hypothetical protein DMF82_14310 [Acidobacteria bacterium]|nr:MAG: hypothetical protein DMF82_14310 [Acidobacteriota bacterium]
MLDEPSNAADRGGSDVVAFDQTGACASLCLNRYRVTLTAIEPLDLPAYLGSTLRGAFGHVFRRVACLSPQGGVCPAPQSCPYHLVFEPVPSPDAPALTSFDDIPRPFVIGPPPTASGTRPAGSDLTFDLTLVGRARSFLPYFIVALRELRGIGRGRHSVALRRLEAIEPLSGRESLVYSDEDSLVRSHDASASLAACQTLTPPAGPVKVRFLTCTRLKHEGQWAVRPEFHVLFRRLLGRLSSLAVFHCGARLDLDFIGLIEQAKAVKLVTDCTRWEDWSRYSSRQDRRMTLGGLVGEAVYEGPLEPLWPFLVFGQWTHVGKNATFGLGRYQLVSTTKEKP